MPDPHVRTLTDDGISEEFFKLIWSKDELNFGPSINIPDTIFFKYGQPTVWYFTGSNGRIKKKNKQNLLNAKIEESFNKFILGYDVVAKFISIPVERDPSTGQWPPSVVEYLDRAGLNDFLYKRNKSVNGALQRFIEPKGLKNEVIRALWSPKICLLERAENIHALHDNRFGIYEKCVTFEGPEYYYKITPLRGPVLAGQIQKLCESIVAHINEVSFGQTQISRMVLNFQVDSRDNIWLTNSTSIRMVDMMTIGGHTKSSNSPKNHQSSRPPSSSPSFHSEEDPDSNVIERKLVNLDSVLSIPTSVNLNPQVSHSTIVPKKRLPCLSCGQESLEDHRHPVTYKSIILHYEHLLHLCLTLPKTASTAHLPKGVLTWPPDPEILQAAGGVGFGCLPMDSLNNSSSSLAGSSTGTSHAKFDLSKPLDRQELRIPPILRCLHPKLTAHQFHKCHEDPLFLYKTVLLCENCYLVYAEFTTLQLRLGEKQLNSLLQQSNHGSNPSHPTTMPSNSNDSYRSSIMSQERPRSEDWKAFRQQLHDSELGQGSSSSRHGGRRSRNPGTRTLSPSRNHRIAKLQAIGLRSHDEHSLHLPEMPSRSSYLTPGVGANLSQMTAGSSWMDPSSPSPNNSYSYNSLHPTTTNNNNNNINNNMSMMSAMSASSSSTSALPQSAGMGRIPTEGSGSLSGPLLHPPPELPPYEESVPSMIAARERQFFQEISRNPELRSQHPLMHLLTSQEKLRLADQQGGVFNGNAPRRGYDPHSGHRASMVQRGSGREDNLTQGLNTQLGRTGSPYTQEIPYILGGKTVLPSMRKKAQEESRRKQAEERLERQRRRKLRRATEAAMGWNPHQTSSSSSSSQDNDEDEEKNALHQEVEEAEEDILRRMGMMGNEVNGDNATISTEGSYSSMDGMNSTTYQHKKFLRQALKSVDAEMKSKGKSKGGAGGSGKGAAQPLSATTSFPSTISEDSIHNNSESNNWNMSRTNSTNSNSNSNGNSNSSGGNNSSNRLVQSSSDGGGGRPSTSAGGNLGRSRDNGNGNGNNNGNNNGNSNGMINNTNNNNHRSFAVDDPEDLLKTWGVLDENHERDLEDGIDDRNSLDHSVSSIPSLLGVQ